jgi:hypothetical protein
MQGVLASLVPSGEALLDGLRPLLTDELVGEMAASDVPFPEEVLPNTARLTDYRDTGAVPGCLPWNPGEVCALFRWERSADAATAAMKLFAGWILIRAYVQPESLESVHTDGGDEHAVVAIAESALDLGGRFPELAARLLAWPRRRRPQRIPVPLRRAREAGRRVRAGARQRTSRGVDPDPREVGSELTTASVQRLRRPEA